MRVLVCGGRKFNDYDCVRKWLDRIKRLHGCDTIIHGGASGADSCAHRWAVVNGVKLEIFRAQWNIYGRSAGPIRNAQMIEVGKPDLIVAFPGGKGTADMVRKAQQADITVVAVTENESV